MSRVWLLRCSAPLLVLLAACSREPSASSSVPTGEPFGLGLSLEGVPLPAPEGSGFPQLTASARGVILSWIEQGESAATLKFSERTSSGWSAAQTVASGEDWFLTSADVPSVLRMKDGTLVANYYPTTDATIEAYDIRLSYSKDEGKTWAKAFSPHHDGTKTQHGFTSMLELPTGGLGMVWLDGRDQELNTTDPLGGSMAIYYASFDAGWTQTAETSVNARVCECCQTAVAVTDDGVLTAFRDRTTEEIRDIKVSRLDGGAWTPETTVHDDNWKIDACPVNGPALSARGKRVAAAWFSAPNDNGRAFAAFSEDAGRTWSAPIRLDDEASLGRVDIELLDDGSAVASWVEFAQDRSWFKVRRINAAGMRSPAINVPAAGRVSGYPRMIRTGRELVLAWEENDGGQQLKGAIAHLR